MNSLQSRTTHQRHPSSSRLQRAKATFGRIAAGAVLIAGLMIPGSLRAEVCPAEITQSKAAQVARLRFKAAILMEDISALRRKMGISTDLPARLHTHIRVDRVRARVRSTLSSDCGSSKGRCPIPVSRIENWSGAKIRDLRFADPGGFDMDHCVLRISEDVPVIPDIGAPTTLAKVPPPPTIQVQEKRAKAPSPKARPKASVPSRPVPTPRPRAKTPAVPRPVVKVATAPPPKVARSPAREPSRSRTPAKSSKTGGQPARAPRPSTPRPTPAKTARTPTVDELKIRTTLEAERDVPHHTEMELDAEGFISHRVRVKRVRQPDGAVAKKAVAKTRMCGMREIKGKGISYMAWQIFRRHIRSEVDALKSDFSVGAQDAFLRIPITAIPGGPVKLRKIMLFIGNKRQTGTGNLAKRLKIDVSEFQIGYPGYIKRHKGARGEKNTKCIFVLDIPLDKTIRYNRFIDDQRLVDVAVER